MAGGDTDIGVGAGFFSALTRDNPRFAPYAWNVEAAWFGSLRFDDGAPVIPYNDGYAKLTIVRFLGRPLKLDVRASFTDEEILYYHGLGNGSAAPAPPPGQPSFFTYGRVHPSLYADLGFRLLDHVAGTLSARFTGSWLHVAEGSRLAEDARAGSAEVRALIGPLEGFQAVQLFGYGMAVDTRDNETSPHAGTFDELTVQASPGGSGTFPYRYVQISGIFRAYVPLGPRVTFAARVVGDALLGDPPFAELPRFADTYAVGGSNGVRGVPAQRYYGRLKAFGNIEARARFFDFRLLGKTLTLGAACFLDGGRVWADVQPHPELDGTGIGLKYGVGGGVRLMSGSAFVMRADVAWSPDATPIGAYVAAGEMF